MTRSRSTWHFQSAQDGQDVRQSDIIGGSVEKIIPGIPNILKSYDYQIFLPPPPSDGPSSVYVPSSSYEWSLAGVVVPTECYACQETTGSLLPTIASGSDVLSAPGAGHLWEQTVTGWTRKFVGFEPGGLNARWDKTGTNVAAGESYAMLFYASWASTGSVDEHLGLVLGTSWMVRVNGNTGLVKGVFANSATAGAAVHDDITTVRPYLWVRNASDDTSRLYTDLEQIDCIHSEIAVSNQRRGIGSLNTPNVTPQMRVGLIAIWRGEAAENISRETLLKLHWPLSY